MRSYLQERQKEYKKASGNAITQLTTALKSDIDLENLKDNKLLNAVKGKEEALKSIMSISNSSEIDSKVNNNILKALEMAFNSCLCVLNLEIKEDLPDDILYSVSKAKAESERILRLIADKIDYIRDYEDIKQIKIDNVKKESLIERFTSNYGKVL